MDKSHFYAVDKAVQAPGMFCLSRFPCSVINHQKGQGCLLLPTNIKQDTLCIFTFLPCIITEHVRTEYKSSESLPAGLTGKRLRRFPAALLQNPRPQSPSSALISSYRHGACGRALPGSQTLSSATTAVEQSETGSHSFSKWS